MVSRAAAAARGSRSACVSASCRSGSESTPGDRQTTARSGFSCAACSLPSQFGQRSPLAVNVGAPRRDAARTWIARRRNSGAREADAWEMRQSEACNAEESDASCMHACGRSGRRAADAACVQRFLFRTCSNYFVREDMGFQTHIHPT
eukprot:6172747-Pleurochrysis_carterae.AAC.9